MNIFKNTNETLGNFTGEIAYICCNMKISREDLLMFFFGGLCGKTDICGRQQMHINSFYVRKKD